MANRHSNKKLRLQIRRRMEATGETYQQARSRLASGRDAELTKVAAQCHGSIDVSVDLVIARYFGWPITLAVFEATEPVGHPVILRIPSSRAGAVGCEMPVPFMNFRRGEWQ